MHQASDNCQPCSPVTMLDVNHRSSSVSGKSRRRPPHKTTESQKRILLAAFEQNSSPRANERDRLAKILNVERRIVKNWFSNQRAARRKNGRGYTSCEDRNSDDISRSESRSTSSRLDEGSEKGTQTAQVSHSPLYHDVEPEARRNAANMHSILRTTTNACYEPKTPSIQDAPLLKQPTSLRSPPSKSLSLPPTLMKIVQIPIINKDPIPHPPQKRATCSLPSFPICYPESALRSSLAIML